MHQSDEETTLPSPISILEDKISNILQNATVDMSGVSPFHKFKFKKVRFRDDNEVRFITSPNANTEYTICEHEGKKFLSLYEESNVAFISVEEILNANREYVKMKIKSGNEVLITKVIYYLMYFQPLAFESGPLKRNMSLHVYFGLKLKKIPSISGTGIVGKFYRCDQSNLANCN